MLVTETNIIYNHEKWVRTISPGVRANAGSGRDVKRQSRFLRLFTTPSLVQNIDEAGEDPDLHLSRRSTVQHGLNLSTCTFATISIISHCTTSLRRHHNGAPAVATRKLAPIGAQATLETTSVVGRWQDAGRDKSKRPQCAKCTRWTHAAANVHDQAQAEQP
jgi:hypothetical protein